MTRAALFVAAALGAGVARAEHPSVSWDFQARAVPGEVRVLPALVDAAAPALSRESYVGAGIPVGREAVRRERTAQLARVPEAFAAALPGALNAAMGPSWGGDFAVGRYPAGARRALRAAVRGRADLPEALGRVGRGAGGEGALVTWVERIEARPITALGFAGEIVGTELGPVVVDHRAEPYRVVARVGVALVAADGDVVLRYRDTVETVLSADGPDAAARHLARDLAAELALVWPADPRLRELAARR
jgi:hypothetical protein